MKNKRFLLLIPLLVLTSACRPTKPPRPDHLEIPTVNVEGLSINLPDKPVRSYTQDLIDTDGTYDYLSFYEVSDFHGGVNYSPDEMPGLSKLSTYLEELRSLNEGGTVILSSGDMYQGSVESNLTRGYLVNYCMNYMGFDAMTLGNHEFDWTDEWIKKNSNLSYKGEKIDFLCANLIDKRTNERPDFVKPSKVITRGNYKIGIVGTIGYGLETSILKTCVENYEFQDEVSAVKEEARKLKEVDNCDVVIWSSHNGVDELMNYDVNKSDGIDAVFGGHAHVSSYNYNNSHGIPYAATAAYAKGVACITLKINKLTKAVSNSYTTVHDLTSMTLADDPAINSIINQYSGEINKIKNIELGNTEVNLERGSGGVLKSICVDAMQKSAKSYLDSLGEDAPFTSDKAVAAFHNIDGGIRSSISKGTITYGDVYSPFPFDNEIVFIKMTGLEIYNNCTKSPYSYYAVWHSFKKFTELDFNSDYYIMIIDFLALSKLNLPESSLIRTGLIVRDEIAKYIFDEENIDVTKYRSFEFRQLTK